MLYISSDHAGFTLKNHLVNFLRTRGVLVEDLGPQELNPQDDYPEYVLPVVAKLQADGNAKAVLICKNGVGVNMLANKFKNVRATLSWNADHAKSARVDDDTNVLTLPSLYVDNTAAEKIVEAWLDTDSSNAERHKRRLEKVNSVGEVL